MDFFNADVFISVQTKRNAAMDILKMCEYLNKFYFICQLIKI